jgi:hypothetical protein
MKIKLFLDEIINDLILLYEKTLKILIILKKVL